MEFFQLLPEPLVILRPVVTVERLHVAEPDCHAALFLPWQLLPLNFEARLFLDSDLLSFEMLKLRLGQVINHDDKGADSVVA